MLGTCNAVVGQVDANDVRGGCIASDSGPVASWSAVINPPNAILQGQHALEVGASCCCQHDRPQPLCKQQTSEEEHAATSIHWSKVLLTCGSGRETSSVSLGCKTTSSCAPIQVHPSSHHDAILMTGF